MNTNDVITCIQNATCNDFEKAPRVFGGLICRLFDDVCDERTAAICVQEELSNALTEIISDAEHPEATIRIAIVLWVCNFLVGANLKAALRDIAGSRLMPRAKKLTPMALLFNDQSGTITGVEVKASAGEQCCIVTVDERGVGKCVMSFMSLLREHLGTRPENPEHIVSLLQSEESPNVIAMLAEVFAMLASPYRCLKQGTPIHETFVYVVKLLKLERVGSSPELEDSICNPPDQSPRNNVPCCAALVATVLLTFFLRCD